MSEITRRRTIIAAHTVHQARLFEMVEDMGGIHTKEEADRAAEKVYALSEAARTVAQDYEGDEFVQTASQWHELADTLERFTYGDDWEPALSEYLTIDAFLIAWKQRATQQLSRVIEAWCEAVGLNTNSDH